EERAVQLAEKASEHDLRACPDEGRQRKGVGRVRLGRRTRHGRQRRRLDIVSPKPKNNNTPQTLNKYNFIRVARQTIRQHAIYSISIREPR
ncbi:unnamed protein product, partial [Ectocarpus fasciculatus]